MSVLRFVKKHKDNVVRAVAAVLICGLSALLIIAFRNGKLPHASDGDAFDTIYALEQEQA